MTPEPITRYDGKSSHLLMVCHTIGGVHTVDHKFSAPSPILFNVPFRLRSEKLYVVLELAANFAGHFGECNRNQKRAKLWVHVSMARQWPSAQVVFILRHINHLVHYLNSYCLFTTVTMKNGARNESCSHQFFIFRCLNNTQQFSTNKQR